MNKKIMITIIVFTILAVILTVLTANALTIKNYISIDSYTEDEPNSQEEYLETISDDGTESTFVLANNTTTVEVKQDIVSIETNTILSEYIADSDQLTSIMPEQSYVGVWYTDENRTDEILIYEITDNSVKFNSGICRQFGFTATAIESDGEIVFGDGVSPDYSGPDMIRGRLRFENDSVTVIYDNFGNFDYLDSWSNIYQFGIKDDNSDCLVEQFKEARHLD